VRLNDPGLKTTPLLSEEWSGVVGRTGILDQPPPAPSFVGAVRRFGLRSRP